MVLYIAAKLFELGWDRCLLPKLLKRLPDDKIRPCLVLRRHVDWLWWADGGWLGAQRREVSLGPIWIRRTNIISPGSRGFSFLPILGAIHCCCLGEKQVPQEKKKTGS